MGIVGAGGLAGRVTRGGWCRSSGRPVPHPLSQSAATSPLRHSRTWFRGPMRHDSDDRVELLRDALAATRAAGTARVSFGEYAFAPGRRSRPRLAADGAVDFSKDRVALVWRVVEGPILRLMARLPSVRRAKDESPAAHVPDDWSFYEGSDTKPQRVTVFDGDIEYSSKAATFWVWRNVPPVSSPLWGMRAIAGSDAPVVLGRYDVIGGVQAREYFTSLSIQCARALYPDDPFLRRKGWTVSAGFLVNLWVDSANLIRRITWGVSAELGEVVLPWHQLELSDFGLPLKIDLPEVR